ncbi:hypothetical protein J6590_008848 [Homalodisca vitripennis]|nr:hypothetical protein J6590_008848 [Homalodisca vitripennis]
MNFLTGFLNEVIDCVIITKQTVSISSRTSAHERTRICQIHLRCPAYVTGLCCLPAPLSLTLSVVHCSVKFVAAPTTLDYRKSSIHGELLSAPVKSAVVTQISPRIFPDYYRSPYINQAVCVQVPAPSVPVPGEQLSPTSVLSEGNEQESFVDCECVDDSGRTDSLSDDQVRQDDKEPEQEEVCNEPSSEKASPSPSPVVDAEVTCNEEVVPDSSSTLEKLQSVESVESAVTDTGSCSVASRSVSDNEVGRRTSVIDPPSGFQTSTPSSKEDLGVCETEVNAESLPEPLHPPVVEVPPWTRTDLRASAKLFRGQSVDKHQRSASLTVSQLTIPLLIPVISVPTIQVPEEDETPEDDLLKVETIVVYDYSLNGLMKVESTSVLLRRSKLLRSASTGQEVDTVGNGMTVTNPTTSQSSVLLAKHWGPERAVHVLREPNCSLGISIVGGKVDLYNAGPDSGSAISGIFIKNVLPQSPAGRTNELKTGDRILEVDGIDLRTASHERAVDVIRAAGNPVRFLVQSLVQWSVDGESEGASGYGRGESVRKRAPAPPSPTDLLKATPYPIPSPRTPTPELIQDGWSDGRKQSFQGRRASTKSGPPPKAPPQKQASVKKYSSDSDSEDDEEDTRDMEGRIYTKKGVEISRASAGNVKRTKEEIDADPEEEDDFGYTNISDSKGQHDHGQDA